MSDVAQRAVRKAVIPVAGLGTRFLPATKATPKEMLPVVDKPAIQYVVEEAVDAGLRDVLMITGRNKRPLEDHFDRVDGLEAALAQKGDDEKLAAVRHPSELADIHYVRQGDPKGLGHAVLKGRQHVGDEPFAVLLGDDLIDERSPILPKMIEVAERTGGSVVALMEVPPGRSTSTAAPPSRPPMTMRSSGSPVWSRSPPTGRPRRTSPSSAAMCWPRRSSTSSRPRGPAAATRSRSPTPCRSSPERRTATVSTESCSRAPAMTPVTSSTTSRPSCRSPATARTSARISRDGSRATFPHSTDRNPRADRDRGSAETSGPTGTEPESEGSRAWPVILTDGQSDIVLRPLRRRDEQQWREVRRFNRDWLRPWDATLPAPGQELPGFRSMVRMQDRQAKRSQSVPFAIEVGGDFRGQITVSGLNWGSILS